MLLNHLAADPRRAGAMGTAGRHRAVREFGWGAVARRTLDVYESVMELRKN
ncbi:glycosyltransferase [Streptomyces lasiicapitis]|uniref:glycosyltransferase n=1 Tax=Streptomyces lasiicapitis TaxID=1923961 RepID=UPI003682E2E6